MKKKRSIRLTLKSIILNERIRRKKKKIVDEKMSST